MAHSAMLLSIPTRAEPASPMKQIRRDAMTESGRRYRLAGFEALLNDCHLFARLSTACGGHHPSAMQRVDTR